MSQLCIYTAVSGEYVHYIPLFLYWLNKSYPEYDTIVEIIDSHWYPGPSADTQHVCNTIYQNRPSGITTAALRFVGMENRLRQYDYVLITDIDIMHMREKRSILEQHLDFIDGRCYDNYFGGERDRVPGVHFVTRGWWNKTQQARIKYHDKLLADGAPHKGYDEEMLLAIIRESELEEPFTSPQFWTHGVHLGTYRDWKRPQPVDAMQSHGIAAMLDDADFMAIVKEQSIKLPILNNIFSMLKRIRSGQ